MEPGPRWPTYSDHGPSKIRLCPRLNDPPTQLTCAATLTSAQPSCPPHTPRPSLWPRLVSLSNLPPRHNTRWPYTDMTLYSLTVLCALFQAAAGQAAPAAVSRQLQACPAAALWPFLSPFLRTQSLHLPRTGARRCMGAQWPRRVVRRGL